MLQAAPPRIKGPKRVARPKVAHSRVTSFTRTPKLPRYAGSCGAGMGVHYCSLEAKVTTTSTAPHIRNHSWITRQIRKFQAWKLKRDRRQHYLDLETRERINKNLELAKASLPPLAFEQSFTVSTLEDYVPAPESLKEIPSVPFVEEPKTIAYRGLALTNDGEAIRNILINGMRTQDVGNHSSTYLSALSAGSRGALRQLSSRPLISVTGKPGEAAFWGKLRSLEGNSPLVTVVKMNGNFQGKNVEFIAQDIPASQIEDVIVLLNINNNLTWCKVQLNPDNTLLVTPYSTSLKLP